MLTPQEQRKAERNIRSLPKAVELMCKRCVYDPAWEPPWRQQVEDCTVKQCPLFNWRPCVAGPARKHGKCSVPVPQGVLKLE